MPLLRVVQIAVATLWFLLSLPSWAQDCPKAETGRTGFAVSRQGQSPTEVFHVDDHVVRTVWRSGNRVLLETTLFAGLFQLERIDNGRRAVFTPRTNLATLLPAKPGSKMSADFDIEGGGLASVRLMPTAKDALYLGPCKYEVIKIDRSEGRGGNPPNFIDTDYYSPELKLILGREYKDGGRLDLIKFDKIQSLKP